ncbi:MAG: hypothetical protein ACTHMI_24500 [Mucilaginibacter sp.]
MFDSFYEFTKVCKNQAYNKSFLYETTIFRFETAAARYTVELERYHHDIFIIKFYRTKDSKNKNKFNIITNENNCTRIILTCIQILLSVLKTYPLASFGFVGANTIKPELGYIEAKRNTKRFRVYKTAMENMVGEQMFHHSMDEIHSTYLMVNNRNKSVEDILEKAKKMFEKLYPISEDN